LVGSSVLRSNLSCASGEVLCENSRSKEHTIRNFHPRMDSFDCVIGLVRTKSDRFLSSNGRSYSFAFTAQDSCHCSAIRSCLCCRVEDLQCSKKNGLRITFHQSKKILIRNHWQHIKPRRAEMTYILDDKISKWLRIIESDESKSEVS
jgi:hypothetical protein